MTRRGLLTGVAGFRSFAGLAIFQPSLTFESLVPSTYERP